MEREEKEAFWLVTNMLYENVAPSSLKTFEDQKQVLYLTKLANNYILEGRLIPKPILDFIKSKVVLADLRAYIASILDFKNDTQKTREKDKSTMRILLDEIKTQEQVELPEEESNLLTRSQLYYLEKLIYGKAKKRDLLFEGCARCVN